MSNICDFDRILKTECNLQHFIRNWRIKNFDLMKYRGKVKGEQVITLQMAQQLKTKNVNVVPGQLSCRQCKDKFLLETGSLYW